MTNVAITASVIQMAAVLLLASIFGFKLLPDMLLDSYRQSIFELRDLLFDDAMAGKISFKSPAYMLLREQMNAMIRYAHHLSFSQMVFTMLATQGYSKSTKGSWQTEWARAIHNTTDPKVRERLLALHSIYLRKTAKFFILRSPVLWLPLAIVAISYAFKGVGDSARQVWQAAGDRVADWPVSRRQIEDVAYCSN